MISILNSIKLRGVATNTYKVDFDKDAMSQEDADISLSIKTELHDSESEADRFKLSFEVVSEARDSDDKVIFNMHLKNDYFFEIIDKEPYFSVEPLERAALSASFCYLDFRRKIIAAVVSTGLGGFKLPLSLQDLQVDN
ncbi:hypothetical protein QLG07_19245 [Erwinia sp. V90_4]|uniref:hypothetical protein n=1 Tax=Erwinia sp. V90_4 TaxID=3044239 RepID=UPI00249F918F|nr:hypothetical protein [Erwinia sp. V90_4]MDI3441605.1 hypothetical protein [Erwinia sp. V90_4]